MNDPEISLATPERVALDLPLAGLGSRAMAYLVDLALLFAVGLVSYFAFTFLVPDPVNALLGLSGLASALIAGALFVGLWIYWALSEVLWNGQTPGKRLMRIRVVKLDGTPVTVFASAVRNLLRLVDFLPLLYAVGVITMLLDGRHRRLGDVVAGTVLVREDRIDLDAWNAVSTHTVDADLVELALSYLARFEQFEPEPRQRLGLLLAKRLGLTLEPHTDATTVRAAVQRVLEKPARD